MDSFGPTLVSIIQHTPFAFGAPWRVRLLALETREAGLEPAPGAV